MAYSTDYDPSQALQLGIDRVVIQITNWGQLAAPAQVQSQIIPFSMSALAIDPESDIDEVSIVGVKPPMPTAISFHKHVAIGSPYIGDLPASAFKFSASFADAIISNKPYGTDYMLRTGAVQAFGTALDPSQFTAPSLRLTSFIAESSVAGAVAKRKPFISFLTGGNIPTPGTPDEFIVQAWPFFGRKRGRITALFQGGAADVFVTGLLGQPNGQPMETDVLAGPTHADGTVLVSFDIQNPTVDWLLLKIKSSTVDAVDLIFEATD